MSSASSLAPLFSALKSGLHDKLKCAQSLPFIKCFSILWILPIESRKRRDFYHYFISPFINQSAPESCNVLITVIVLGSRWPQPRSCEVLFSPVSPCGVLQAMREGCSGPLHRGKRFAPWSSPGLSSRQSRCLRWVLKEHTQKEQHMQRHACLRSVVPFRNYEAAT